MLAATAHGFRRRRRNGFLGAIQTGDQPQGGQGHIEGDPAFAGGFAPPLLPGGRLPPTRWSKAQAAAGQWFTATVGPTACAGAGAGGPADVYGMLAPVTTAACTPGGGTPPPPPTTPQDEAVVVATGGNGGVPTNGGGSPDATVPTATVEVGPMAPRKAWWPWAVGAVILTAVGAYVVKAY